MRWALAMVKPFRACPVALKGQYTLAQGATLWPMGPHGPGRAYGHRIVNPIHNVHHMLRYFYLDMLYILAERFYASGVRAD